MPVGVPMAAIVTWCAVKRLGSWALGKAVGSCVEYVIPFVDVPETAPLWLMVAVFTRLART
jgi:hypothetical protein